MSESWGDDAGLPGLLRLSAANAGVRCVDVSAEEGPSCIDMPVTMRSILRWVRRGHLLPAATTASCAPVLHQSDDAAIRALPGEEAEYRQYLLLEESSPLDSPHGQATAFSTFQTGCLFGVREVGIAALITHFLAWDKFLARSPASVSRSSFGRLMLPGSFLK